MGWGGGGGSDKRTKKRGWKVQIDGDWAVLVAYGTDVTRDKGGGLGEGRIGG
jgi:hypothetical protein